MDLGFFHVIQALQHEKAPRSLDDLIAAVEKAFNELEISKLNYVFLTMQMVMESILKLKGGNDYKLAHMSKHKLDRNGSLPISIACDPSIVM